MSKLALNLREVSKLEKELKIIIYILKDQLDEGNYDFFESMNAIALICMEKDCLESNIKKLKGDFNNG